MYKQNVQIVRKWHLVGIAHSTWKYCFLLSCVKGFLQTPNLSHEYRRKVVRLLGHKVQF